MKNNKNDFIHNTTETFDGKIISEYIFSPTDEIQNNRFMKLAKSCVKDTTEPIPFFIVCKSPDHWKARELRNSLKKSAGFMISHYKKVDNHYRAWGVKLILIGSIKSELTYTNQLAKLYSGSSIHWGFSHLLDSQIQLEKNL